MKVESPEHSTALAEGQVRSSELTTVLVALDVLEFIARQGRAVRLTDIGRTLNIPKARVYRILSTLVSRGYVQRDPISRQYSMGLKTWLLGLRVAPAQRLLDVAQPFLDRIATELKETVYLALLDSTTVLYIYTKPGTHPVRAFVEVGSHGPIYATATGKAMLAYQTRDRINAVLQSARLQFTPSTKVDQDALRVELKRIRRLGYAVAINEWYQDVGGIAAPILDQSGIAFAAIGISSPTSRLTQVKIRHMGEAAKVVAAEIALRITRVRV